LTPVTFPDNILPTDHGNLRVQQWQKGVHKSMKKRDGGIDVRRLVSLTFMIFLIAITFGCQEKEIIPVDRVQEGNVSIQKGEGYYLVTIDLTQAYSRRQTGENYGKAIKMIKPDYEQICDSYIHEATQNVSYDVFLKRIDDIKGNLPREHAEEIEGLATVFSGPPNSPGDGQLAKDEVYFMSLISDVIRGTQCSAVSVFGDLSSTKKAISGRNLDWTIGRERQLAEVHAVTVIKNNEKSVCLISVLGFLGCITGFNDDKVFAAMLDSPSGLPYSSSDKRSYSFDMRYALENLTTLEEIADHLADPEKDYAFNHLFFLSDENKSMVLENNFSGTGTDMKRALRSFDSELNESVSWGIENAIGAVNSFLLKGNHDNHTEARFNYERWSSLISQVEEKANDGITYDEIKEIISFDNGDGPNSAVDGDLYMRLNVQMILFQPDTYKLEIAFAPADADLPTDPIFRLIFDGNPFI
jgi:hypothetical protein